MDALYEYARLPVVSTGFPALDLLLGGGFRATQPYCLAAGTGQGKTSMALQMASRYPGFAVIWTLEMDPHHLQAKMIAQRCNRPYLDVLHGGMKRDEYQGHLAPFHRVRFYNKQSISDFERVVRKVASEANECGVSQPILIIVDYLQKLAPMDVTPRDAVSQASEVLRKLAQSMRAIILIVTAVGRNASKRIGEQRFMHPGELVDVGRESGAIEYDTAALLVLGLDPEDEEKQEDERVQTAVLSVAKNRFGKLGQIEFRFDGEFGRFTELGKLENQRPQVQQDLHRAILDVVNEANGEPLRKNAIAGRVTGRKKNILRTIDTMVRDGELEEVKGGYVLGRNTLDVTNEDENEQ